MEKKQRLSAEEMLEAIFYDMNLLVVEKDFYNSILLLTDLGRTLVNAERASFWYRDVRKKQYWTLAALDSERITVPEGSGIVGASIENNETILINNPYEDERFNSNVDKETGFVTKSILCVPVTNGCGEVIGAYQAINKIGEDEESEFDAQDIKRLALAAAYCGKTLEAQLLREQSQIDQLTGLRNRRGFYDYYENNLASMDVSQRAGIVVCDIDFFKKVNDTYGHNVGDAVLVFVADTMQKVVGKAGEVFRWGGEEFIILFKGCDKEETAKYAEELRCTIKDSECHCENQVIKITMSFGVSEIDKNISSEKNVKSADDKLYTAKQTGRNKVVS